MYCSQGYLRYFALFLILSLCSIGQVSSRKCYACNSDQLSDCITGNLTQAQVVDCNSTSGLAHNIYAGVAHSFDTTKKSTIEFDCGYSKGVALLDGRAVITRGCAPKYISCDTIKTLTVVQQPSVAVQINSCKRCDSDLCNSSGHLNAGFWILSLSLLMGYLIKL